ncbi:MAG TPA: hypothetical protein ENK44_13480 [Caldithrix abyssi]|uniref:Uncharacterized protein n=1 Tax=Caldithrix abyssi TaxID=187145 RepID=A0A7V4U270_CALAY|nr:hypothetical protein [Caldithrix abyssi]
MGKKSRNKKLAAQEEPAAIKTENEEIDEVEKIYKLITRIMSWIVGVTAISVVVLPEFNSIVLDKLTQVLYYIFIITLLLFILLEFVGKLVKRLIKSLIGQRQNA